MYRNTAWSNPGKLTKPASNRTTAQLEGYHGVILKELLQSANTSSELATKLLTLANKAYNMDREVRNRWLSPFLRLGCSAFPLVLSRTGRFFSPVANP
jgi:hypothetical protein